MKALTLHQPWATLVALGIKTVETRSWYTPYRGPLAIHAGLKDVVPVGGMHLPPLRRLRPGAEQDAANRQTWFCCHTISDAAYQGPRPVNPATGRTSHIPRRAQALTLFWPKAGPHHREREDKPEFSHAERVPLGAIVATCRLADCVPTEEVKDRGAQRPYGDFTPGRWAWLLDDIIPLDPPEPARGARGLWEWGPGHRGGGAVSPSDQEAKAQAVVDAAWVLLPYQ